MTLQDTRTLIQRAYRPGFPPVGLVDRLWMQQRVSEAEGKFGKGTPEADRFLVEVVRRQVEGT